jgi:hypothetical protein
MQAIRVLHRRTLDVWSLECASSPSLRRPGTSYVPADIASTSINQTIIAKQAHTFLVKTLWRRACDVVLVRRQAEKHASGCRETKKQNTMRIPSTRSIVTRPLSKTRRSDALD